MFKDHFIHLFKYNEWATKESAKSLKQLNVEDERPVELMSHIVSAQNIWLNRITKNDVAIDPWQKNTIQECITQSTSVTNKWVSFLENLDEAGLRKQIQYKNNKGEDWENTIGEIVTHVINHSTYHRAQIAQLMRQLGKQPPKTDYILYQRLCKLSNLA